MTDLTPEILLKAYAMGYFPMARSRTADGFDWVTARLRGVLPLEGPHVSRSLARHMRRHAPEATVNRCFDQVLRHCADRPETWINAAIFQAYGALHRLGHAHSLEVWEDGTLVGGVYGVALGGAFFGESMFSTRVNGSKLALTFLMHRLRAGGFVLCDTQFLTPHLASLGGEEIPRATYEQRLAAALQVEANFFPPGYPARMTAAQLPSAGSAAASGA